MSTIAGMSKERLKRIDAFNDERYPERKVSGGLTLVSRKGEVAHCSAQGLMDAERGKAVREDTSFRIYSIVEADHVGRAHDALRRGRLPA